MTRSERNVYDAVQRLAANGSGFVFYASPKTTAAEAGCSVSTVQRSLADLGRLGVVWEYRTATTFKKRDGRFVRHWKAPNGDWVPSRIFWIVRHATFTLKAPLSRRLTDYRTSKLRSSGPNPVRHFVSYAARALPDGSDAGRGPPTGPVRRRRRRRSEPDFTALVRATGSNVRVERGALNAALRSIRDDTGLRGAELALEIEHHAKSYRRLALAHNWTCATPTPMALAKWWDRVVAPTTVPRPAHQVRQDDRRWRDEVGWVDGPKLLDREIRERLRERGLVG